MIEFILIMLAAAAGIYGLLKLFDAWGELADAYDEERQ